MIRYCKYNFQTFKEKKKLFKEKKEVILPV